MDGIARSRFRTKRNICRECLRGSVRERHIDAYIRLIAGRIPFNATPEDVLSSEVSRQYVSSTVLWHWSALSRGRC